MECETTRELSPNEEIYRSNPVGMAGLHYEEEGTARNPYPLGSQESLEYCRKFHHFLFIEDRSL